MAVRNLHKVVDWSLGVRWNLVQVSMGGSFAKEMGTGQLNLQSRGGGPAVGHHAHETEDPQGSAGTNPAGAPGPKRPPPFGSGSRRPGCSLHVFEVIRSVTGPFL